MPEVSSFNYNQDFRAEPTGLAFVLPHPHQTLITLLRIPPMAAIHALLAVLALSAFPTPSTGDPRTTVASLICNRSTSSSDTARAANGISALTQLNTLVNSNGYGSVGVGTGPNSVYCLVQCYGDLNSTDCPLCFTQIRAVMPGCLPGVGGRTFLDGCFGRYGNYNFSNQVFDSTDAVVCNSSRNSTDRTGFARAVRAAVGNVSAAAPGSQGFAVGSANGSDATVYALAQCWRTLDRARCTACLKSAAANISSCSPATEGRALYAGCYMRYSTKLFWNVNQTLTIPPTKAKSHLIWIILGSSFGALLLITSIVIWIKRDLWIRRNAKFLRDLYGPGAPAVSNSNLYYKYAVLKKATNNFGLSNKLGQGSYGTVYKAVLSGRNEVAVKRLFLNTKQWVDQFLNEVYMINRVRHKNLVKLLGCSVDGPESLLVYEYYCNKSLDLFIFDATPDKCLDWQQRLDIIQGVAEGLCYLHEESETRIIHRDIKASNILMDEKFRPRITDFGLARSFSEDQTHLSTGIAGTRGYMAPEYVVHGRLTVKADVYSFGILIHEIVTGKRCSSEPGSHAEKFLLAEIWHHYKAKTLDKIIDEHLSEALKDEILHVVQAGLLCTQADPRQRPTMSRIVEFLRSSRRDEELVLTDPAFLDDAMVGRQEAEVFQQISGNSAADISRSSYMSGR